MSPSPTHSWSEATVSGVGGPAPGAPVQSGIAISSTGWVTLDVTAQLISWLNGSPNNGLIITANPSSTSVFFDSKENVSTSHPATLEVVFSGTAGAPGLTGPPGAVGLPGSTGAGGPVGPTGDTGPIGADRTDRSSWPCGCYRPRGPHRTEWIYGCCRANRTCRSHRSHRTEGFNRTCGTDRSGWQYRPCGTNRSGRKYWLERCHRPHGTRRTHWPGFLQYRFRESHNAEQRRGNRR